MIKKTIYGILTILFQVSFLYPQSSEFKPEVKIGGTIFTGWEFNVDNAGFILKIDTSAAGVNPNAAFGYNPATDQFETSQNTFYLDRAYINVFASVAPNVKGRITTDIFSFKDQSGTTQYSLGIKYAWVDWTAFKTDNGMSLDLTLGVIPNRWINTNDKYWGYRGFAKTLTDFQFITSSSRSGNTISTRTGSYFPSADLGLEGSMNLPKGFGELYLSILNGNGFRNLGYDSRFKDFIAAFFIHPLAEVTEKKLASLKKTNRVRLNGITDLTIGGFAYLGKLANGENTSVNPATGNAGAQYERNRFGGMLSARYNFMENGFLKIGGEVSLQSNRDPSASVPDSASKVNASGISAYLEFNPPVALLNEKLMLVARYDVFDPNTENSNTVTAGFNDNTDKQSLLILGLAYKPAKIFTFGVTYQAVSYQSNYVVKHDGTTLKSDSRFVVHGILDF